PPCVGMPSQMSDHRCIGAGGLAQQSPTLIVGPCGYKSTLHWFAGGVQPIPNMRLNTAFSDIYDGKTRAFTIVPSKRASAPLAEFQATVAARCGQAAVVARCGQAAVVARCGQAGADARCGQAVADARCGQAAV